MADHPSEDCALCPRLAAFRATNRIKYPDFHNGPVPSFGDDNPELLIIGLAPGLKGANRTARPFTGDFAGDLLFATLDKFGFSQGQYQARADDGLRLRNVLITNAVCCVPPQNKTIAEEENNCRPFLISQIRDLPRLKLILALGGVAHKAVLTSFAKKKSACKFAHGALHPLGHDFGRDISLIDSYHCSRYNVNTGRLTTEMFEDIFRKINIFLKQA